MTLPISDLFIKIGQAADEMLSLIRPLSANQINQVPFDGSWTAAQLLRHVTKSTNGIAHALVRPGGPASRDPYQRIDELEETFLDFSTKMESPEFILPESGLLDKSITMEKFERSFRRLKEGVAPENMNELVQGLPLGDVTKIEMLHFVWFHTERHLHQLRKIVAALQRQGVNE